MAGRALNSDQTQSPEAKRRKIRKGTRSCWECKRRKVRCTFESPSDPVCVDCLQRGTNCLSQDQPQDDTMFPTDKGSPGLMGERMLRMEILMDKLVREIQIERNKTEGIETTSQPQAGSAPASHAGRETRPLDPTPTPASATTSCPVEARPEHHDSERSTQPTNTTNPATIFQNIEYDGQRYQKVSLCMLGGFPRGDIEAIQKIGAPLTVYFNLAMNISYASIEKAETQPSWIYTLGLPILARRDVSTHPVLLGRDMILLATVFQSLDLESRDHGRNLSQSPRWTLMRFYETVNSLVTGNDDMIRSKAGFQCLVMEALLHSSRGSLQRAWLSFRKAINLGQLMGMHRPRVRIPDFKEPRCSDFDHNWAWHRLVYMDRMHSLLLGTAQGISAVRIEPIVDNDAMICRLDYKHSGIASSIIERNEADGSHPWRVSTTRAIDTELQNANRIMPGKWWQLPLADLIEPVSADVAADDTAKSQSFLDLWKAHTRIMTQINHFYLLSLLHLPFVLSDLVATEILVGENESTVTIHYSRTTCLVACREVLNRFLALRNLHNTWSPPDTFSTSSDATTSSSIPSPELSVTLLPDYYATLAAVVLVLAHILNSGGTDDYTGPDFLAHHRAGDIDLAGRVLETWRRDTAGIPSIFTDGPVEVRRKAARALEVIINAEEVLNQGQELSRSLFIKLPHIGTMRLGAGEGRVGAILMVYEDLGSSAAVEAEPGLSVTEGDRE